MKLIGLDVGTKRIGVAKADTSVRIAVPVCTINVDGTEISQIARLARVHDTRFFVVGLPRNNSGEETEQSKYSREFARQLKSEIKDAKIAFQDESLTSVLAEERLKAKNSKKKSLKPLKKGSIDAEAATIILQDFIENIHAGNITSTDYQKTGVMPTAPKKYRLSKKAKITISSSLAAIVLLLGASITYYALNIRPVQLSCASSSTDSSASDTTCGEEKKVTIEEGASVNEIADLLKNRLLIRDTLAFKIYLKLTNQTSSIKAGTYTLSSGMSVSDIISIISDGAKGVVTKRLTTLPGGTLSDFRTTLKLAGFTDEQIDDGLNATHMSAVLSDKPESASLEGYIYGETIEYTSTDTVADIIDILLEEYETAVITYKLESKFAAHGLSLYEGITLASIVQKEASNPEDMAIIAGIFYNRLAAGMNLGSDVTVQYALDQVDPDRTFLTDTTSQLNVDSCYNTRKYSGLPCGPIATPGISALKAVAYPTETSYLYFLTGDDGLMYYGTTYAEHEANMKYCKKLCSSSL